ncbi:low temperature requirement protein A [Gluconobacter kanchanaburiensis]|uniref:Uncharacterized protein n=1 Tax=Gluconobacter kanchanaburiensis NBRC 103587 TaxID=1307948 RepID=A0A511BAJ1_9PROT|nr:low temperature requirement protein A [Gluconobacter kanchanaburiensis]GBR70343.1 hypothetical protein AA103587_1829 [Gluconobacter kanchanaburiensis NBRC 103587]GEK96781.1 hypothetical protein GKA01_19780 [Gluconobacter kanchanaburiensis NBRC 103587]
MTQPALMRKSGDHKIINEELFFDLIYVFLVTQVSHGLLHHLNMDRRAPDSAPVVRDVAGVAIYRLGDELVRSVSPCLADDSVRGDGAARSVR